MRVGTWYVVLAGLILTVVAGCGGGGGGAGGMVGSLALSTTVTGPVITATATYSNSTATDLTGLEVTFKTDLYGIIGTARTDSTGKAVAAFRPPSFDGTKTITVIATVGNIVAYSPLTMTGRTLTISPPATQNATAAAGQTTITVSISDLTSSFVVITDPFTNDISGHPIAVTATFTSNPQNSSVDRLSFSGTTPVGPNVPITTSVTTGTTGNAPVPATVLTLDLAASLGGSKAATIKWEVRDTVTGLTGTGFTTVTVTGQ